MDIICLIVSIIGLAVTYFGVGYAIGKDIHYHDDNKQK